MAIQSSLLYLGFEVSKVIFDKGDLLPEADGEFQVNVKNTCNVAVDDKNNFLSSFVVGISAINFPLFDFQVEAFGKFRIEGDVDKSVYDNFTDISAPSIVYPYLRAFVSITMMQAGFDPLYLPALNFSNSRDHRISESK